MWLIRCNKNCWLLLQFVDKNFNLTFYQKNSQIVKVVTGLQNLNFFFTQKLIFNFECINTTKILISLHYGE